jgi:hypothetical protein
LIDLRHFAIPSPNYLSQIRDLSAALLQRTGRRATIFLAVLQDDNGSLLAAATRFQAGKRTLNAEVPDKLIAVRQKCDS